MTRIAMKALAQNWDAITNLGLKKETFILPTRTMAGLS